MPERRDIGEAWALALLGTKPKRFTACDDRCYMFVVCSMMSFVSHGKVRGPGATCAGAVCAAWETVTTEDYARVCDALCALIHVHTDHILQLQSARPGLSSYAPEVATCGACTVLR